VRYAARKLALVWAANCTRHIAIRRTLKLLRFLNRVGIYVTDETVSEVRKD
jgi:hypothetical protein